MVGELVGSMEIINLKSRRLSLERVNMDGLLDFHNYSVNKNLYKYLEYPPFSSMAESKKYLHKLIDRTESESNHYWFIKLKSNKVIGTIGLIDIDYRKGMAEVGYGISPEFWGQGYFKEALAAVLDYCFGTLGFHRVWAKTHIENKPSIAGLEKIGFKQEGVLRDFYLDFNGSYYDAVILSILDSEYIK